MVRGRIGPRILVCIAVAASVAVIAGCSAMRSAKPIIPVKDYEKLIAGRLDADYVGDRACLSKCHEHDQYKKYFDASTMGAQLSLESGLPLVNCESCHGPGSESPSTEAAATVAITAKAPGSGGGFFSAISSWSPGS